MTIADVLIVAVLLGVISIVGLGLWEVYKGRRKTSKPADDLKRRTLTPELEHDGTARSFIIAANIAAGHPEWGDLAPKGWVWHKEDDGKTASLVPKAMHDNFPHTSI
jgi:hypothetical protein